MRECRRLGVIAAVSFSLAAATALADEKTPEGPARLQLSFIGPVQLVPESRNVSGLRLGLFFGKNAEVSGLDIAAGGTYSGSFSGLQVSGFLNWVDVDATGVQLALLGNSAKGEMTGLQVGFMINGATRLSGVQIGGIFANIAREGGAGLQVGVSNFNGGKFTGVQVGLIGNAFRSEWATLSVTGVQIGAINGVGGDLTGIQVGAWNAAGLKQGSLTGVQLGAINLGSFTGLQVGALNVAGDCKGLQIGVLNLCGDMRGVQIGLINFIREGAVKWLPIVNAKF